MATEYYTMTDERTQEIARVANLTVEQVREFCLADWPEGAEHQDWLNTASAQEIADWILVGRN